MSGRIASPELIGRETELDVISRALAQATAGQGRTLLIGGEAGVGKTRLLANALEQARTAGATVLQGGCVGLAEGSLPFAPIVEAIRPLLGGDGVDDAVLGVAAELGLVVRHQDSTASAELRPEWARSQLYETFLRLLRRLADDAPVVLAIEDLHWAGDSTRELLAFLVRNARTERLLLLVTFRSDELHRRHPLLLWLGETDRSPGVERLELPRLGRPALARLLDGILGREAESSLVGSIFARSEGNPFFAEELVAAGAESGPLPPTLREVLAARLAHVSEPTLRLLGVAALVGRHIDHDLLARVSELGEDELDEALSEAVSRQILVTHSHSPSESGALRSERYAFRHALLAEAAAETVLPGRRRRLHAAIARALSQSNGMSGAEEAGHLVEIAHHWFEARELGEAFKASLRAGKAAQESGAYAEALRQYERAGELWDIVPDAAEDGMDRMELLRQTAHSAQLSGEYGRAIRVLNEAIELARLRRDDVLEGLLYERLGRSRWSSADFAGAEEAYRRAVELVPEEPLTSDRARVLAGFAQILMLVGRPSESLGVARRALEIARQTQARQLEGHALCTLGVDMATQGDTDGGAAIVGEAIKIAEEVHDLDDIGRGYANLASVLEAGGRLEESTLTALTGARRLRELGMAATYGAFNMMNAVDGMITLGRWTEALAAAQDALPLARGTARVYAARQLATLLTLRGDFEGAARALDLVSQTIGQGVEAQFNGPLAVTRLDLATLTGNIEAGRQAADHALPMLAQTEDKVLHARALSAAVRLEAEAGEHARAGRFEKGVREAESRGKSYLEEVGPLAEAVPQGPARELVEESIALAEAEYSRLLGTPDVAKWRHAARLATRRGPYYDVLYATFRLAEALLADKTGREEAAELLRDAYARATALEALPLSQAIAGLAARARVLLQVQPDVRPEPAAAEAETGGTSGLAAYGLSEREVEVLRLLASGLTNRQIGEALFISESTAGVHVSHILGKLGVAGRVEAATIAARLGVGLEKAVG